MPVRIVKKEDVRKAYPPHGLPTKSNQTPDDFLFQVGGFSSSQSCAGLPILGEHGQPGKSFAEGAPNAKKLFKRQGGNVNARNKDGNSPLLLACSLLLKASRG